MFERIVTPEWVTGRQHSERRMLGDLVLDEARRAFRRAPNLPCTLPASRLEFSHRDWWLGAPVYKRRAPEPEHLAELAGELQSEFVAAGWGAVMVTVVHRWWRCPVFRVEVP